MLDLDEDADGNNELDDDTDTDGVPDYLDTDDDNDGVPTSLEDLDNDGDFFNNDTDNDGIPNFRDADDDNDGILTINEDFNRNGNLSDDDNDNDGIPDYLDNAIIPDNENISQGISPNGDGNNDVWRIPEIEGNPNNQVTIFNRSGRMVYQIVGYDNTRKAFRGISNQNTFGSTSLPDGSYFFVIDYVNGEIRKGFLLIN